MLNIIWYDYDTDGKSEWFLFHFPASPGNNNCFFWGEYWIQDGKNIFVELISKPLICNIFPEPSAGIKPPLKKKSLRASTPQLLSPDQLISTLNYPQTGKNTASSHSVLFLTMRFVNSAWRRSFLEALWSVQYVKQWWLGLPGFVASSAFLGKL